ncbi:membrane-spanning 4-domains subfamily A member 8 isoform X2 [Nematostella vectensis]|uniref:membrane-spanning 4-domains subfamily A member 8 isoform X2 n=1 Tax=Nematostella vectensis TaxID=45351 RepID=UPI0020774A37|nr:membrane-spanning 4-domains subfamily A member 8 isoform X2 [Nematostella vectensis]
MAYKAQGIRTLGIAQIVIGSLMAIFGISSVATVSNWTSIAGFGIWIGIWVVITGVLGYIGAKDNNTPNNCLIGTMIGFAVTACVLSGIMIICYSIAVGQFSYELRQSGNYGWGGGYPPDEARAGLGFGIALLILALTEFFISLASSIYGCNSCCCVAPSVRANQQQVVYLQAQPGQPGQPGQVIVLGPNGAVTGTTTIQTYPNQAPVIIQQPGVAQGSWFQGAPQGYPQGYCQGYPQGNSQGYPQQQPYQTKNEASAPPAYSAQ